MKIIFESNTDKPTEFVINDEKVINFGIVQIIQNDSTAGTGNVSWS